MFNLKVYTMKRQRFFEGLGLKVYVTLAICMALLLNVQFLNAQSSTINVKGVVNDAMGPVIGASVVEKGNATNGTITDIDGNFSLKVPSDATLTISFIGYKTVELPVAGKTSFTVTLKEDSEMLDEVVVVGFGTQKKVNLTGSVGLATAKEIEARPVANATQALQGLVPGLQITTNTGELDKNMSINIRGNGTIGDGSSGSPLILIDGMEGDINTVNPQDIENISVLKDAAASSIYGSRAPFGVILVTTKKGKSGKPTINYNNSFRFNSPVNLPEMMDSYTFANYFNEAARNGQDNAQFSDTVMQQMLDFHFNGNADTPAMSLALGGERDVQTDKVYHQASLVFEPVKNWITNVEFNYSTNSIDTRETGLPYYNHDVSGNIVDTQGTSSLYQDYKKESYMNWNIYSTYSLAINDDHNFKVMGGFQSEEMRQKFFSAKGYGLQVEDLPELDLISNIDGAGKDKVPEVGGYRNEWATAGFFGRLNYDYKGRYLAEANLRYDGTSRFRRGNRWQLSPSFSLGWNIAQENFWEDFADVCNQLKFRFSYGELGNMNTNGWYPTYRAMTLKQANGSWLQNGLKPNTAYVGDLISTALTWEKVRTWNIGLDWGLFNNRLTGSFDAYIRYTDNMVGPSVELPATLGIATPKTNNCDLKTKGWELTIGWQDRTNFGMGYGIKFNVSDARTYIDRYPGNPTNSINTYIAGREIGEIWGFETVGIAKTDDEMQAHLNKVGGQSAIGSGVWTAGDIMYADQDGKPGITKGAQTLEDHGDLKVIGNNTPRYHFGLDLNANYKGFDVRLFFQGVMKRDYWQGSNIFWGVGQWGMWWSTGLKEHEDYFRDEPVGLAGHEIAANVNSYYARPRFDSTQNQETQTRYLQDASYIRLKNFQLGYTLPASMIRKIGITNCRIFVSGENLWTGTKLSKLFDPETISGGNTDSNASAPIKSAGNAYPLSRTWSFGLSVSL